MRELADLVPAEVAVPVAEEPGHAEEPGKGSVMAVQQRVVAHLHHLRVGDHGLGSGRQGSGRVR